MKGNIITSFVIPILLIVSAVIALPPIHRKDLWRGVKTPANIVHLLEWKFSDIAIRRCSSGSSITCKRECCF